VRLSEWHGWCRNNESQRIPSGLLLRDKNGLREGQELIFRQSCDTSLNRIETACEPIARGSVRGGSGDIQRLQIGPAKSAGRYVFRRHFDDLVNLAARRNSNDTGAIVAAVAEIAFGVDGRTVSVQ
jgi:hypothetical protein